MKNRYASSAVVALLLCVANSVVQAQPASAPRMAQAMQAAQSIRDARPDASASSAAQRQPAVQAAPASTPQGSVAAASAVPVPPSQVTSAPNGRAQSSARPASAISASESDEYGELQTQAMHLKVKAEIAKYQAEIAKSQAEIKSAESRSLQPGMALPMGQVGEQMPILNAPMSATVPKLSPPAPAASAKEPRLIRVTAADGRYTADIEVNGHPIFGADVGTALDGDWVVVAVDSKQVTVARGKQKRVLKV